MNSLFKSTFCDALEQICWLFKIFPVIKFSPVKKKKKKKGADPASAAQVARLSDNSAPFLSRMQSCTFSKKIQ